MAQTERTTKTARTSAGGDGSKQSTAGTTTAKRSGGAAKPKRSAAAGRTSAADTAGLNDSMATFEDTEGLAGTMARGADASGHDRAVKVSVAIPRSLWAEARAVVGDGSLSALVTEAVRRELAGRRTDAMLDELDEIHGPVPAEVRAEVEAELGPLAHRTGH